MEFLLIVLALSFVIQLLILSATEQLSLRLLGAALMEMIPVSGMIYYTVARPDGLLFGWGGNVVLLLWTAGAVLLGCAGAWLLSWIKKRKVRGVYVSAPGPVGGSAPSGDFGHL